ncbi:MAG TPA: GTPase CgtA [Clostridiales bacterium]|nr:GTPase CgtA [Clostridiales bacterium]
MFLDVVNIYAKAGNGGDGKVSFHREKYVMCGGPDGGDGGKGGSVVFVADSSLTSLIDFKFKKHFRAENGAPGEGGNCFGKNGQDIVIKVPTGTVIKDKETGGILADMYADGERKVILKGGKGGRGNARFATPTRRTPSFAELGELTVERNLTLELKTIADVGLVGFPNVGKSTLLSVLTNARPKIANYHFTTLSPNLGVIKAFDKSYVIADIPGLIEGAAEGLGLGHTFLRHVERVRLLVHVVDISGIEGRDPVSDYNSIREELRQYNERLASLPEIVVANKTDLITEENAVASFEERTGKKVIPISAAAYENIDALVKEIFSRLNDLPLPKPLEFEPFEYEKADPNAFEVKRLEKDTYEVTGGLVDMLIRKVVLSDHESNRYFQNVLKEKGVIDKLKELGAKDGDTIIVGDVEFELWN